MQAASPAPLSTGEREALVGQVLAGRYEITRQIGVGGMGAVYEARHTLIGKRVAVKVLLDKYANKEQVIARLEQEARLASSIGHPNIVDITDFGETADGRRFVVMEYLEGASLSRRLADEGPMPAPRIAHICVQIASALGAAHKKGIVHRDVKPDNVFLIARDDDPDVVKVVDFGISKALRPADDDGAASPRLTQTGMVLGTPLYMSPEQARGDEQLDHRIDIYALGVIMYELATGQVPFTGTNYLNIISQVLSQPPRPPREVRPDLDIPPALEAIILKALAKDPAERYQTMDELADDLRALAGGGPVQATRESMWALRRAGRSRTAAWVAAVAVIVAAMAVTAMALLGGDEPRPAAAVPAAAPDAAAERTRAAAAGAPDAAPPQPETVDIELRSRPPGATVWADGGQRMICSATPCTWRAVRKDAVVPLIFELDGYDDAEVRINPLVDTAPQVIRLVRARRGHRKKSLVRRRPPESPPEPGSGDAIDDTVGGELMGNPVRKRKGQ
ncbi:MAG: serine/threonine protein kinase [Deltaproteobacteria bacterium]|nr:MAG: serine/threonine protein kinase [Deltaproteobacteria bacterium]